MAAAAESNSQNNTSAEQKTTVDNNKWQKTKPTEKKATAEKNKWQQAAAAENDWQKNTAVDIYAAETDQTWNPPPGSQAARGWPTVPKATFEALGLPPHASPDELYDALAKRYYKDFNPGKFANLWEPIPMDKYFASSLYYKPPQYLDFKVTREQCVVCHQAITHGWVNAWQKSAHANLDTIRNLPKSSARSYQKRRIKQIQRNLRSEGLLGEHEKLQVVGCIDCHMGVGMQSGNHAEDLRMPDRAVCGVCHVRQFAESESMKDTLNWPQNQWPNGRPSHALDYTAAVELATWAAMPQRAVAEGCVLCHTNQPKCDTCHTRHQFALKQARKPAACAMCHSGVDHNEFHQYMFSKHGTVYRTVGKQNWNWNAKLEDAIEKGGYTAPTCQYCHMEYKGEFTHNLVRKVRWGFVATAPTAKHINGPWYQARKEAWIGTCSDCHSPRFAETYLTMMDKAIGAGVNLVQQTRQVVHELYEDGLIIGQKTNQPALPKPVGETAPGGFASLFMSKGNTFTMIDRVMAEMWEQDVNTFMKGVEHVNPGGWTYTNSWNELIEAQIFISQRATQLRNRAELLDRVDDLEEAIQNLSDDQAKSEDQNT